MRILKYITLLISIISIILAVAARILAGHRPLFGLVSIAYLRITITMLLFTLTFHFLFPENR